MQESEEKGSPIAPTDNQIAVLLFMLSHYIADAHMPFHCDSRRFSEGADLHGHVEGELDDIVRHYYQIDEDNERFYYDPAGYPLRNSSIDTEYQTSILKTVEDELGKRKFILSWGADNNNVWDFMSAICQYSYLLSYSFIPAQYNEKNITLDNWKSLGPLSFNDYTVAIIVDAIDSVARSWFKVWRRYMKWERKQRSRR
jgi:hypothetical protein